MVGHLISVDVCVRILHRNVNGIFRICFNFGTTQRSDSRLGVVECPGKRQGYGRSVRFKETATVKSSLRSACACVC
jgi:hypothetical protein